MLTHGFSVIEEFGEPTSHLEKRYKNRKRQEVSSLELPNHGCRAQIGAWKLAGC